MTISGQEQVATRLAAYAMRSLLEELRLTPKPGLVDLKNNGCHHDLTLELMERSANSLTAVFFEMAMAAYGKRPCRQIREQLAAIGRQGEGIMMAKTGNVNTHRGAIWVIGLLTGATSMLLAEYGRLSEGIASILETAGAIARFEDCFRPAVLTNGARVRQQFPVRSAREEAAACFPSLQRVAVPAWIAFREEPEPIRRLNVLLALMSVVDDTCILHRSDMGVLNRVRELAGDIIRAGGMGVAENCRAYEALDQFITRQWVSPGGSADLLAATIFLHKIVNNYKIN
jgi:triphosphoribosyl-dephospho-CoA synthase